ncbi:hypothetical protein LEMLEM_LOCUS14887 [Lemmus lemmus]
MAAAGDSLALTN